MGSKWPFHARRRMHLLILVHARSTIRLDGTASGASEQNEPANGCLGSNKTKYKTSLALLLMALGFPVRRRSFPNMWRCIMSIRAS